MKHKPTHSHAQRPLKCRTKHIYFLTFYGVYFHLIDVSYEDTAKYVCKALTTSGRDHANLVVYSKFAKILL